MSLSKPFEDNSLQNASQIIKSTNGIVSGSRSAPMLPPRPSNTLATPANGLNNYYNSYNSCMPSMPYSGKQFVKFMNNLIYSAFY